MSESAFGDVSQICAASWGSINPIARQHVVSPSKGVDVARNALDAPIQHQHIHCSWVCGLRQITIAILRGWCDLRNIDREIKVVLFKDGRSITVVPSKYVIELCGSR